MLSFNIGLKSTIINSQKPRTNQALEVILTENYKNMDGNVLIYNIRVNMDVEKCSKI